MKSTLYVAKEFGRYHFFNSEDKRTEYINSLTEWEQKFVQTYQVGAEEKKE